MKARLHLKDEGGVGGGNVKPRLFEECEGAEKVDFVKILPGHC